jgi:putative ABC transport system permease protein
LNILRRLAHLFRRSRADADLAEEIESHRAMLQDGFEARGLTPKDAARASRRALGNFTLAREDARQVWLWQWIDSVGQDLAYACRGLRRQPGFAATALITLGIGIGFHASLFTTFNTLVVRSWPVRDPDAVVLVQATESGRGNVRSRAFNRDDYRRFAEHSRSFEGLVAIGCGADWTGCDAWLDDQPARFQSVSGNLFSVLGIAVSHGRPLSPDDDRPGRTSAVAVLSDRAWRDRFASDPAIIGRVIRINEVPFDVVGVTLPDFPGLAAQGTDVWLPLSAVRLLHTTDAPIVGLQIAGRLKRNVTVEQARSELEQLWQPPPLSDLRGGRAGIEIGPTTLMPGDLREVYAQFLLLFSAALLVLLLACANVGNLLVARGAARTREIATRVSLGAGRARLIRQLLTESLVLSGGATLIGLAIAFWLPGALFDLAARLEPDLTAVQLRLRPDLLVLTWTCVLTVVTSLACGLIPAFQSTAAAGFKEHAGPFRSRLRLRHALLATQVGISVVLLVAAGLLARSVGRSRALDLGFDVDGVTVMALQLPSYYDRGRRTEFTRVFLERARHLANQPGVCFSTQAPFGGQRSVAARALEYDAAPPREIAIVETSARYFDVLRIPILRGRPLEESSLSAVVVNETLARTFWGRGDPIGRSLAIGNETYTITGVAKDADTLGAGLKLRPVPPTLYASLRGPALVSPPTMLLRNPSPEVIRPLADVATRLDGRVRVEVSSLVARRDERLAGPLFLGTLAGLVGTVALAVATIGIFGVFAYIVEQRQREIGIRMALGARIAQVLAGVLGSSVRALAIGIAVGLAAAAGTSQLISHLAYGISPLDGPTYAGVAIVLAAAALAATWVPARRAARIDPVVALRNE